MSSHRHSPRSFSKASLAGPVILVILALAAVAAGKTPESGKDTASAAPDVLAAVVSLMIGLAWPITVLLLVYVYRATLQRVFDHLEHRIAKGDKFSALGLSVEAPAGAPIPAASSPSKQQPETINAITRALGIMSGDTVLVSLGETSTDDDESGLIGTGDALGLALVQATLLGVAGVGVIASVVRKKTPAVSLLSQYPAAIGIGGPFGNRLTKMMMSGVPLTFEFRAGGVYDLLEQRMNVAEFINGGMAGVDWAILAFLDNSRRRGGRVCIVAGYSGYGTNAAAVVFSRLGEFIDLSNGGPTEALIRVEIANGVVGAPEVVTVRKIQSADT